MPSVVVVVVSTTVVLVFTTMVSLSENARLSNSQREKRCVSLLVPISKRSRHWMTALSKKEEDQSTTAVSKPTRKTENETTFFREDDEEEERKGCDDRMRRFVLTDDRNNRFETTTTLRWDGIQKRSRWSVQRREEKRFETRFGCGVLFFYFRYNLSSAFGRRRL